MNIGGGKGEYASKTLLMYSTGNTECGVMTYGYWRQNVWRGVIRNKKGEGRIFTIQCLAFLKNFESYEEKNRKNLPSSLLLHQCFPDPLSYIVKKDWALFI